MWINVNSLFDLMKELKEYFVVIDIFLFVWRDFNLLFIVSWRIYVYKVFMIIEFN